MDNLILTNPSRTVSELITDFDIGSFKYERETNNGRSISFSVFKTAANADIYNMIQNESIVTWRGQEYVIKSTDPTSDNVTLTNSITANHIMYEFQNHYVDKELEDEELNGEDEGETAQLLTLEQFLDFGFKDNKQGYTYKIVGDFKTRKSVSELGNKNGIEHLIEGSTLFDYYFYADNKVIGIYDEANYYTLSDVEIIGGLNTDKVNVSINTEAQKTFVKGYGKKKTKAETKEYKPVKPADLSFKGKFIKEGTWYSDEVGAYFSKTLNCEWGNETMVFSLKKMSKGGIVEVFLDNESLGRFNTYSKTATTEKIIVGKSLTQGSHYFKCVFIGPQSGVDYGTTKSRMYVGTEKTTILNLTAVLKGEDIYHTTATYTSPFYDPKNPKIAPTVYDDEIDDPDELEEKLKAELNDEPVVELSTNYLDKEMISDRDKVYFKHDSLGFDSVLRVVKVTESHPLLNLPVEVDFSNSKTDILKIQQEISNRIKNVDRVVKSGSLTSGDFTMPRLASDSIGSVMTSE
ncbi:prophage endopeptidase tail family protein [Staphylococcus succinus]|uniref:prophage endopeptidase tail family protein n=1 Tax=Staphylococcus succinus TaxID=61015 RepID=UPI00301CF30D